MLTINRVKKFVFPLTIFLFVIVLSMLRIHGSSIGYYNKLLYGPGYKDPNLLFGQIRAIRFDEWRVSTPWALAQVNNGLKELNTLYLGEQNLSLSDPPTKNVWGLFEPQNWSFTVLPVEQAFARVRCQLFGFCLSNWLQRNYTFIKWRIVKVMSIRPTKFM